MKLKVGFLSQLWVVTERIPKLQVLNSRLRP